MNENGKDNKYYILHQHYTTFYAVFTFVILKYNFPNYIFPATIITYAYLTVSF